MTKVFWACTFVSLFAVIATLYFIDDKRGFSYGVLVALFNLGLSRVFLRRNRRKVSRYPGQALVAVLNSMVVRIFVVGVLIVLGLSKLNMDAKAMIVGFVLGQVYYIVIHLLRIIEHGK